MPNFNVDSNYSPNAGIDRVRFGEGSPLLETELNEIQLIQLNKLKTIAKNFIGNMISSSSAVTYSNGIVTLANGAFILVNGYIIKSTGLTVSVADGQSVYLNVTEALVDHTSTLKEEGNQQSAVVVPNYIKDSRVNTETSKRVQVQYTLSTVEGVNSVKLGTRSGSAFNLTIPVMGDTDYPVAFTEASTLAKINSGSKLSVLFGNVSKAISTLISHLTSATLTKKGELANKTLTYGGTFKIPVVTKNENGHVTDLQETTMTMPAETNVTVETTGTGNAVTGASVVGHKVTLTKGETFVPSAVSLDEDLDVIDGDLAYVFDSTNNVSKKTKLSTIKDFFKTYFDTLYSAKTHTHGNVTNDGKVGTASGKYLATGTGGAIQANTPKTAFDQNFETTVGNIKMNGTPSLGTSANIPRADHVHPPDTTKADVVDTGNKANLQTPTKSSLVEAINEVYSMASASTKAISYNGYSDMVTAINAMAKDNLNVGQNILIGTVGVPDLWVYSVEATSIKYTYTTDTALINALTTNGQVQMGYYKLMKLDSDKVDLTDYLTKTGDASNNTVAFTEASTLAKVTSGSKLSALFAQVSKAISLLITHLTAGTSTTVGDSANQTPAVGGTFKTVSVTKDAQGHVTSVRENVVTLPTQTSVTGNAGTATKLQTARNINGVAFDGTKNIDVTANAKENSLTTENLNDIITQGSYYGGGGNTVTNKPADCNVFGLVVSKTAITNAMQELTYADSGKKVYRMCTNTTTKTWTDWTQHYTSAHPQSSVESANTAKELETARKIELAGDAKGSVDFKGDSDVVIDVEIDDDKDVQTGTFITSNKSEDGFVSVNIKGKSTQVVTTQGKNICPTDFSEWESGWYGDGNGLKASYPTRLRLKRLISVTPSTTYYCDTTSNQFIFRTYDINGNFVRSIGLISNKSAFTTESTDYYIGVILSDSTDYDTFKTRFESGAIKPFICLNSESDKNHTPFVPTSPSPDYPSPIVSAQNFDLVSCGVNICNNGADYNNWVNNLTNKPDHTRIEGGFILEILNDNLNSRIIRNLKAVESLISGKTYTLKADVKFLSNPNNVTVTPYVNNPDIYGVGRDTDGEITFTFTYSNQKSVGIYFQNNESAKGTRVAVTNIRINVGSVATPYTPYKEDRINIPLPMRSLPNGVCDVIENNEHVQKIIRLEYDGSIDENWALHSINSNGIANFYVTKPTNMKILYASNYYCNMLTFDTNGIATATREGLHSNTSTIFVRLAQARASTVSELRTLLANNPLIIDVECEVPIKTTLNTYLKSYYKVTNVYTTADIQPELTGYFKNKRWSEDYKLSNQISGVDTKLTNLSNSINNALTKVTNLNDATTEGIYYYDYSAQNAPITNYGIVTVEVGGGRIYHTARTDNQEFYRFNYGSGWTDWTNTSLEELRVPDNTINAGNDLNKYTYPTICMSESQDITTTLKNCPITSGGFKLTVEYLQSTSHLMQTLKTLNENVVYYRCAYNSGSSWTFTNWVNVLDSTTSKALLQLDTRDTNETPAWYWANHRPGIINEFKNTSTLGITGATNIYCQLVTHIPWTDFSGGYITQEAYCNGRVYYRRATSNTAWGAWTDYAFGFTPIQQGGGTGQGTNKVMLGWSGTGLKAQVDQTDLGNIVFESRLNNFNADSVDGYHVDLGVKNTYGLRPIAMDTFDLQAGVTGLGTGQIYIMYE